MPRYRLWDLPWYTQSRDRSAFWMDSRRVKPPREVAFLFGIASEDEIY